MYIEKDLHLDYHHQCPDTDTETTFRIYYSYEPSCTDQLEFWGAPCTLVHPESFDISFVLAYCTTSDRWYPITESPDQERIFQQFIEENHHDTW